MIRKALNKCRRLVKEPGLNFVFNFLMSPAKRFQGRRLFDAQELRNLHKALLKQSLFGIDGVMVPNFENEFAVAYNVPYAVAATSGTAALHTALGALDLNPGDEVITAPITDMGTILPILYQNAIPVFVDTDDSFTMDPLDVEKKITPRTKAIIVVHLFGNTCDMDTIVRISKKHNIPLIEDCAQAHMTEYKGRFVGTIGDIGCFSFQQAKHMTTGDGGMVITSNKAYYDRMKLFVDKGYARKGWGARAYLFLAPNYRMNELTAAVGLAQLKKVKDVVRRRHELGQYMTQLISGIKGVIPAPETAGGSHSYWLYPLTLTDIDVNAFAAEMKKKEIWVGAGYTVKPIYLCSESLTGRKTYGQSGCPFTCKFTEKAYEYKEGLCPKAELSLKHLICVPLDESWTSKRVEETARAIADCVKHLSGERPLAKTEAPAAVNPADVLEVQGQKAVRIAIVGCGQMGEWHLDSYKNNPRVKLAGFADTDIERAKRFASRFKATAYSSHQEMIKQEKLDGVSVCTVPTTHKNISLDLLNAGINVLCEKPLAVTAKEAHEMVAKADEKKLLLLSAFKFRFFEEIMKARDLIAAGGLGKIVNFRLMFGGSMDMAGTWYAKKAVSGGGIILDTAPHAIDLVHYLFGKIERVSARTARFQNLEVEDSAQISLFLSNGTMGTVDISWSSAIPPKTYFEIYGEEGTILIDLDGTTTKFKSWNDWKRVPNQRDIKKSFDLQIDHFVSSILGAPPATVKNLDGLYSQIVIDAAYESATGNNKTVDVVYNA